MFIKVLKRVSVVVLVVSPIFLQQNIALAIGQFTRTCSNIALHGSLLEAICKTRDQRNAQTGIQLNNRIANINGALIWRRNGNFMATSRNCDVDWHSGVSILHCDSQRVNGSWTGSTLNLDERVANIDGQLTYQRLPNARPHDEL